MNENCVVVLPTGLGKTTIALHVIAKYLSQESLGILFLASNSSFSKPTF